jgi:putative membrane protein
MEFLTRAVIASLTFSASISGIPGVSFDDQASLIVAALIIGIVNAAVSPSMFRSHPAYFLGLLTLINAGALALIAILTGGLHVQPPAVNVMQVCGAVAATSWIGAFLTREGR